MRLPAYNTRRDFRYKRRCYYNALMHSKINEGWSVVHGIVTTPKGEEIGHAWNAFDWEGEAWAYDPTLDLLVRLKEYAKAVKARNLVCYSPALVAKLEQDTGHTGPWDGVVSAAAHAQMYRT